MGQQYKENYKRATGRAPGAADSPDDLLRLEDGLTSISGSIIGAGLTTVVANAVGDLVISSSGDGAGTLAAISGEIVGLLGTTVVANGANELEISSANVVIAAVSGDIVGAGGTTVVANGAGDLEISSTASASSSVSRIHTNTVSSGNVGSGEQTIMSFTLPADSFDVDGAGVDVKAWGAWGTNSGNRNAQARFDGNELCRVTTPADATSNNRSWEITVSSIRINSTTIEIVGNAQCFGNTSNTFIKRQRPSSFADLSSNSFPIEVVCENEADSANDEIIAHGFSVTLIPSG